MPYKDPEKAKASNAAWFRKNSDKAKAYSTAWRAKNPEKVKNGKRKRRGYPAPTRPEPKFCEIGGAAHAQKKALCLEHDHVTGKFRGWVCHKCNAGISMLGDTLDDIRRVVAYLESTT